MSAPRNLLAFFICIALVGCSATGDEQLITKGIGSDLYTKDLYKETELLEQYAAYICVQANLPTIPDSGVVPANVVRCDYSRMTKPLWANFLIQGMNDIDRRCDAYLQWLDAKRRGKDALKEQIADTGRATGTIMGFADASAKAINIVGAAFGLLSESVQNYHSRLLLEIDGATVSTIVLTNRNKFRDDRNVYKAASKPEVIYVLRSYLRLCLPFAIEREINAFAANGVQGISGTNALSPLDPAKAVTAPPTPITAETKVFRPDRGEGPSKVLPKINKAIQDALCLKGDDVDGKKGPKTTEAIKIYQYVRGQVPSTGELSDAEENFIITTYGKNESGNKNFDVCDSAFKNFLERFQFMNDPNNDAALATLRGNLTTLAKSSGANVTISNKDTLSELRTKIPEIKKALGIFKEDKEEQYLNNQYTPDMEMLLLKQSEAQ